MNVIGPISQDDWDLMRRSRQNVAFYKQTDRTRFSDAINAYETIYHRKLASYTEDVA